MNENDLKYICNSSKPPRFSKSVKSDFWSLASSKELQAKMIAPTSLHRYEDLFWLEKNFVPYQDTVGGSQFDLRGKVGKNG